MWLIPIDITIFFKGQHELPFLGLWPLLLLISGQPRSQVGENPGNKVDQRYTCNLSCSQKGEAPF